MKPVKEILASKPHFFNVIDAEAKVIDALQIMKRESLSYAIVLENEKYLGIISEKDYTQKVVLLGRNSGDTKVRDIMTSDIPIISYEDSGERCLTMLNTFRTRYLPVFDFENLQFRGVITMHDILREVGTEKNDEKLKALLELEKQIA